MKIEKGGGWEGNVTFDKIEASLLSLLGLLVFIFLMNV